MYLYYKRINLVTNIVSAGLVVSGAITTVTLNPAIIAALTFAGALLKSYMELVKYSDKVKSCEIAFRHYQNIMLEIRTVLRSGQYDDQILLNYMTR